MFIYRTCITEAIHLQEIMMLVIGWLERALHLLEIEPNKRNISIEVFQIFSFCFQAIPFIFAFYLGSKS